MLRHLADRGHDLAVITNQTGPSYGYGTLDEVNTKMLKVQEDFFQDSGGYELTVYACTDKDDVANRKPAPGMILRAMTDHSITAPCDVVMVGDLATDEQAARRAQVAFNWADDFFAVEPE